MTRAVTLMFKATDTQFVDIPGDEIPLEIGPAVGISALQQAHQQFFVKDVDFQPLITRDLVLSVDNAPIAVLIQHETVINRIAAFL